MQGYFDPQNMPNSSNYTFLGAKQYDYLNQGSLQIPSEKCVSFVSGLEGCFQENIDHYIYQERLKQKLHLKMSSLDLPLIHCQRNECFVRVKYIIALYINIRLHHVLKMQNQRFQKKKSEKNQKAKLNCY